MLAATVLAALTSTASAGAAELPEKDPFYKPPAGFEAAAPGTVLRSREVNLFGVKAFQLLFRSSNTFDGPIAAVTTLAVSPSPWAGKGQRPLVSYQMAIDGLGGKCTPSYQLQQGNSAEEETAAGMLAKGWEVNIPDHEGQRMEYGAGRNGAHIVLDSIRALYSFKAAKVGPANPLGLIGYSGGGQATAWTLEQQPSYAPELSIVAAAPGGIPVDLKEVAKYNDGGPGFAIVLAASQGVDRAYPELELDSILNAGGKAAEQKLKDQCISEYASSYPNKKFSEFTKPEYPEPLSLPKVENVLAADSLAKAVPAAPTFIWESAADELIPVAGVDRLADYYCSEGGNVTYDRGASGEHITYVNNAPAAVAYLEAHFNGESVASTCGVNASTDTRINSGPSGTIYVNSASFTYSAAPEAPGVTFECKLDAVEFASCASSGETYAGLAPGPHTFAVRSVTAGGAHRDVTPAMRSFTFTPPPTVTNVTPNSGPQAGGTTVSVTGADFSGATQVMFGSTGAQSFKVESSSSISAVSPTGSGTVDVTVTTPAGTSAATPADQFSYSGLAAHYYVNNALAGSAPLPVISWGTIALNTVLGGSGEVVCRSVAAGTIANPAGGGAGLAQTELFATYHCESTSCPQGSSLTGEALPWRSQLVVSGGSIRSKRQGVKLNLSCLTGTTESATTFVGSDEPSFRGGTSALHPGYLEFDAGAGALEGEGSKGAVREKGEGEQKVLGFEEQELISVRSP